MMQRDWAKKAWAILLIGSVALGLGAGALAGQSGGGGNVAPTVTVTSPESPFPTNLERD